MAGRDLRTTLVGALASEAPDVFSRLLSFRRGKGIKKKKKEKEIVVNGGCKIYGKTLSSVQADLE